MSAMFGEQGGHGDVRGGGFLFHNLSDAIEPGRSIVNGGGPIFFDDGEVRGRGDVGEVRGGSFPPCVRRHDTIPDRSFDVSSST